MRLLLHRLLAGPGESHRVGDDVPEARLDHELPLDRYKNEDPFDNHPLFKTEEQARIEDTMDGTEPAIPAEPTIALKWPGEDDAEEPAAVEAETHDGLWTRSRDFDWGD